MTDRFPPLRLQGQAAAQASPDPGEDSVKAASEFLGWRFGRESSIPIVAMGF
jgi:hypothetical protein